MKKRVFNLRLKKDERNRTVFEKEEAVSSPNPPNKRREYEPWNNENGLFTKRK